jgi:tetratricopeptide (TPR) repeat protein
VLILPFENAGADPRLAWLGEGLAELGIERMSLAGVVTYPRADWLAAMEKLGLPPSSRFSRATMLKIARQVNAGFVMYGGYSIEDAGLTVTANVLGVSPPSLSPAFRETGALQELMEIHARLAWQALRFVDRDFPLSQRAYAQRLPRLRLDAFESHVRGLLASEPAQRIRFFREAARLEPDWAEPMFALGREYFAAQNCGSALIWFSKIVPAHPRGPEAEFYAGLCHLRGNDPQRAEAAFAALLQRAAAAPAGAEPRDAGMQDVLNNLAVAESRQGKWREASVHWQRAQRLEPSHAGYWFNFAVGALRAGEMNSAARGLREAVRLNAEDSEARALLIVVLERAGRATEAASEREACEGECDPTPAIRAIWKAPKAPVSLEALARLDRLSDNPEFSVRQREDGPSTAVTAPRSTGGRQ